MANNAILKTIDLTGTYAALSATPLVGNFTIMQFTTSGIEAAGTKFTLKCGSQTVDWPSGIDVSLFGVDLSTLQAKSDTASTELAIIGNTRR